MTKPPTFKQWIVDQYKHCVGTQVHPQGSSSGSPLTRKRHQAKYAKAAKQMSFYDVKQTLGLGKITIVKYGLHQVSNTPVAIKIVNADKKKKHERLYKRARNNIAVMKEIGRHEHVMQLFEVIEFHSHNILILEYLEGKTLRDCLNTHGSYTEMTGRSMFVEVLSAVEHLHAHSVAHRCLKLESFMVSSNGTVKLVDFGCSTVITHGHRMKEWVGVLEYAAPEVILVQSEIYDAFKADLWSIGVVLFALLHGRLPFNGHDEASMIESISTTKFTDGCVAKDAMDLIRNLLCPDVFRRFDHNAIHNHEWLSSSVVARRKLDRGKSVSTKTFQHDCALIHEVVCLMERLGLDTSTLKTPHRKTRWSTVESTYWFLAAQWKQKVLTKTESTHRARRVSMRPPSQSVSSWGSGLDPEDPSAKGRLGMSRNSTRSNVASIKVPDTVIFEAEAQFEYGAQRNDMESQSMVPQSPDVVHA